MTSWLPLVTLASPLAALAAALVAAGAHRRRTPSGVVARAAVASAWAGLAGAAGAVVVALTHDPLVTPTLGAGGFGLSLRVDAVSTVMLTMIAVLAVVLVRFSATYLDGHHRRGVFLGWLVATVASVELLVLAGNLGLLLAAWVTTSLALHQLLAFHRDRPRAVAAAHKKFVIARVGDVFLLGGVVALVAHHGTGDLGAIFAASPASSGSAGVGIGALCLAVAAILKSAQFPVHSWLVEVMDTPTPVSALLHAGILNAGPFLMIRLAPVVHEAVTANALLIIVGGLTAAFASVALTTQPTVKVALGYSSAAHMGFMLLVCGSGVYAAALLHLVAHSFYKAHAFLSSGSVIDEVRAGKPKLPARSHHAGRSLAAAAGALALYGAFAWAWGLDLAGEPQLLGLGLILVLGVTQLLAPALDVDGDRPGAGTVALLGLAVTGAFFVLESATHHLIDGLVPAVGAPAPVLLVLLGAVVALFAGIIAVQVLDAADVARPRVRRLAVHLRNGFYAGAWLDRRLGAYRLPAAS